jgi:hypothetical protein
MSELADTLFEKRKPKVFLGSYELIARLEKKYAPPSWAFFTEVKSSVGFGNRRADGIAVAMWRSLGLEIMGFEVKRSRADWLKELKDGGKSDELFQYCDRWWVVVADASIVKDGELPPCWGLQVAHGKGFKTVVKAPKLKPQPLTTWFVAEILRRHFDSQKRPEALDAEFQRGLAIGKEQATPHDLKYQVEKAEKLKQRVEEFEKVSGVSIDGWRDPKDIGAAVKTILDHGPEKIKQELVWAQDTVTRTLKEINSAIAALSECPVDHQQESASAKPSAS